MDGRVATVSDEQPRKALLPTLLIVGGIVIFLKEVQKLNAHLSIEVMFGFTKNVNTFLYLLSKWYCPPR